MQVVLFVPAPFTALDGGTLYDRAIVDGLRAAGHAVTLALLDGEHPLPDDAARSAAAAAWHAMPDAAVPVIDGLALPAFEPLLDALAARGALALVHHPTALEAGRSDAARDALRRIECAMLPRLRRVVVTSDDTAQRLVADFGVAAAHIAVVVPGTAVLPRSIGPRRAGCAILSIGNLIPRKGHEVLLRALGRLGDLDWRLTLVGEARDAAYAGSLHALAEELGIDARVTFAGSVAPENLEPLWAEAGLFALASHYEGYGMAGAEALRRGLPLAITAGAQSQFVPAAAGVIVPAGAHDELSKAMRRVIFDPAIRAAMADAAWLAGSALPDWPAQATRFAAALMT